MKQDFYRKEKEYNMRIILASASPRRKELFGRLFNEFEIIPPVEEEICTAKLPEEMVQQLSVKKAEETERRILAETDAPADYLIAGADTVVAFQNRILGKPESAQDAKQTLCMLSDNTHQVFTGVTLILRKEGIRRCTTFAVCTDVTFYPVSMEEAAWYVSTGEPADKAGSYGIQGAGGRFVKRLDGDYDNVVGLPVAQIYQRLKKDLDI